MEIRHAGVEDLPSVLSLWAAGDAEPTVTDDDAALRCLISTAQDSLLIADNAGQVVGSLIVGWDGWRGSFYRLVVHPGWRRQGIARQLIQRGESQLARLGARRIAVIAVASDPRAVPFWEAIGYTSQSDRCRLVKNGVA